MKKTWYDILINGPGKMKKWNFISVDPTNGRIVHRSENIKTMYKDVKKHKVDVYAWNKNLWDYTHIGCDVKDLKEFENFY